MWELFFHPNLVRQKGSQKGVSFARYPLRLLRLQFAFVIGLVCTVQALGRGELSKYFRGPYLRGQVYQGSLYSSGNDNGLLTFDYRAPDGPGRRDLRVLYHYTNELAFHNVADMEKTTAELFASLVDSRAHFGKGVYCTQHEPAVWGSRTRILLNNYSNLSPLRATGDTESQRVEKEWGAGNTGGHRAAFCIPIVVSTELAYNIFEKQACRGMQSVLLAMLLLSV
ncbi:NPHP3 [Symbiodinium necroappetens]|uniref:NPHP3 protein n=1 Tax=Symbiodinium necroappetens TaxID=1628268 RepID=A0A812VX63_9DINO|nr:NPHP3 [Symbiodinium necroappetens]